MPERINLVFLTAISFPEGFAMTKRRKHFINYLNDNDISSGVIQTRSEKDVFNNPFNGSFGTCQYVNTSQYWHQGIFGKIRYFFKGRSFGWQDGISYKDNPELKNHQDTKLHVGLLSFNELKKLFLSNGFKIKKIYKIDYNPPFLTWFFRRLKIRFTPFYSIFCSNSMILFKKV